MANVSTLSPIQLEETLLSRTGISKYPSVVSYREDYGAVDEEMLTNPDDSYRTYAEPDNRDFNDDFREVTVNLKKFGYIIERIENLRSIQLDEKMNGDKEFRSNPIADVNSTEYLREFNKELDKELDKELNRRLSGELNEDIDSSLTELDSFGNTNINVPVCNSVDMFTNSGEKCFSANINSASDNIDISSGGNTERSRAKSHFYPPRDQPYSVSNWLSRSPGNHRTIVSDSSDSERQILRKMDHVGKFDTAHCQPEVNWSNQGQVPNKDSINTVGQGLIPEYTASESGWAIPKGQRRKDIYDTQTSTTETASLPSIIIDDSEENPFLDVFIRNSFQTTESRQETSAASSSSLKPTVWPDSPVSNQNVVTSRPSSRSSSRAQSPGTGISLESPSTLVTNSPFGSPQVTPIYRVPTGLASPSSSTHSYGDTPSPVSYHTSLNQSLEDKLSENFDNLPTWREPYDPIASTTPNVEIPPSIDNNELQLVEEVLRDLGDKHTNTEEAQVVPNSLNVSTNEENQHSSMQFFEDISTRDNYVSSMPIRVPSGTRSLQRNQSSEFHYDYHHELGDKEVDFGGQMPNYPSGSNFSNYRVDNANNQATSYTNDATSSTQNVYNYMVTDVFDHISDGVMRQNLPHTVCGLENNPSSVCATTMNSRQVPRNETYVRGFMESNFAPSEMSQYARSPTQSSIGQSSSESSFEFQIPEMVSSYRPKRSPSARKSDRNVLPWPSLNLPSVQASERLKEELNPKEVEKAMIHLLKRPTQELAKADEDGDTMLMCLVGNPEELLKKKSYLIPLVERLSNVKGALSRMNNRGEDALYLAAMNCPHMPNVTGYLAAAMLQKGIDIGQKLYHTRGDTLIHSIAAKGDSHGGVLAELLALKTAQGHSVFDLSKRNYDGRTALHVAVESHDPTGRGVNAVLTVRLLLENGADPRIKETKCGDTALHMAVVLSCDPALVKVLLSKIDADVVNTTNYNYNTPLHVVAAVSRSVSLEKQKEVCWLLMQAGAQGNLQNRQGKTPLALVSPERKDVIKRIFHRK